MVLGIAVVAGMLLLIGLILFLGEWLFGSLGWGVVHGTLLAVGLISAIIMVILSAPSRVIVTALIVSAVVGAVLSVALALNLPRRAFELGAEGIRGSFPNLDPGWAPAILGIIIGAVLLGVIGAIIGARAGGSGAAIGGLVAGAVIGALLGWLLGGLTFSPHGGVALGITVGLMLWPILQAVGARGAQQSGEMEPRARFDKLWPRETYETALETRTWLEQEWAKRRDRLTKR